MAARSKDLVLGLTFRVSAATDVLAVRWFKAAGEGRTGHTARIYDEVRGGNCWGCRI